MNIVSDSEQVIRRLYEITNAYDKGFDVQVKELLELGLARFNLDIGIMAQIKNGIYTVQQCVVPDDTELSQGVTFDFDTTYCHITCKANGPVAIEHMGEDDIYASHPAYTSFGLESYIGIPLKLNGQLYGTLNFSSQNPYHRKFEQTDIDTLQLMASWVEGELVRRKQENRLKELNELLAKMAFEDSLTLLPNRRALFEHLRTEINRTFRQKSMGTLVIIDIDFFKKINDTYGHQRGDDVLVAIGAILNDHKRNYDYVARFGGEEFILWLPEIEPFDVIPICKRMNTATAQLTLTNDVITMSFGIAHYKYQGEQTLDINRTIDSLIERADNALYRAKDSGRNRIEIYDQLT